MPYVTVLIPVYNAMPFLPSALESILQQTLQDISVLIIDDGSTDGSATYLSQINDPRVRVIKVPHQGLGSVLNVGLEACQTEFLARMDSDDLSLPNRLRDQLAFMQENSKIAAVGTQFKYIGSCSTAPSPVLPLHHDEICAYLLRGHLSLVHATLMFRTTVLRSIGGYRINGGGEDWDLFLRLSEVGQLVNLLDVHYLWRQHNANSDLKRLMEAKIGIDYGCYCAELRTKGEPELTLEEYHRHATQKVWQRLALFLDVFAFAQYRRALADIGDGRAVRGFSRLAFSAVCSPSRTTARIVRIFRSRMYPRHRNVGLTKISIPDSKELK